MTWAMRDEAAWILASAHVPMSPEAIASLSTSQLVALRYLSRRCDDVIRFAGIAVDLSRCAEATVGEGAMRVQRAAEESLRGAVRLGERLSAVVPEAAVRPITSFLIHKCEALVAAVPSKA